MVVPRSSTPRRLGLISPHGAGLIDQDYCGPEDDILVQLLNIRPEPVTVARGERVAQGVFVRVAIADWREVERSDGPSRGGFGSTSRHFRAMTDALICDAVMAPTDMPSLGAVGCLARVPAGGRNGMPRCSKNWPSRHSRSCASSWAS